MREIASTLIDRVEQSALPQDISCGRVIEFLCFYAYSQVFLAGKHKDVKIGGLL